MSEHCILSPSAAERWLNCTSSVAFTKGMPKKDDQHSRLGTEAHRIAACILKKEIIGRDPGLSMMVDVFKYVYYIRSNIIQGPFNISGVSVEKKVIIPIIDGWGTVDYWDYDYSTHTLHVADLKFGKGRASAVKNPQLMLYALGLIDFLKLIDVKVFKEIHLHIIQPRVNIKGFFDKDIVTMEDLDQFSKKVVETVKVIYTNPVFQPGKWCYFCPGKQDCGALKIEKFKKWFNIREDD